MNEGLLIEKTIAALQQRLRTNNNLLLLQLEEGRITEATCTFHSPVSDEDLRSFTDMIGFNLPEDYIAFLKITNGCRLFDHPHYGGENYLYGIWEILENTYEEPSNGYLKIGYFYQENIFIDLKAYHNGRRNYLYVKEHIDQFDQGRALNMNFELWFDRFIINQGAKFWNYPYITAENYYEIT